MARFSRAALMAAAAIGMAGVSSSAEAAGLPLSHWYELNGTNKDRLVTGPDLKLHAGGTLTSTGYKFDKNEGLVLPTGALPSPTSYTVLIDFKFDNPVGQSTGSVMTGYQKVVDFKNRTSDNGVYVSNGKLLFYNKTSGTQNVLSNTNTRLILTRNGSQVTGYVNGAQSFTFTDTTSLAVPGTGANDGLLLFQDDATTVSEAGAGFIDQIAVYDAALGSTTAMSLSQVGAAVPEPAAGGLLAGVAALLLGRRRRANASA